MKYKKIKYKKYKNIAAAFMALLFLEACQKPMISITQEPLTGILCCKTDFNQLHSNQSHIEGELILKKCNSPKHASSSNNKIYATLQMIYDGQKNYALTSDEKLEWVLDEKRYPVEIIQRLNQPLTRLDEHSIMLADGGMMHYGTTHDMTIKRIVFLIPYDLLKKLSFVEEVRLELLSREANSHLAVSFWLKEENIEILEQFKHRCVDQPIINEK